MLKSALFAFALLSGGSALALAQAPEQAPASPQQPTNRADLVKTADTNFGQTDINNDGFINRDEMQAAGAKALRQAQEQVQAKATEQFAKLDTDKNGQLSRAEFRAAVNVRPNETPDQLIAKFDSNKDGRVSAAEFRAPALAAFDRLDSNKDGTVTPEEARAGR